MTLMVKVDKLTRIVSASTHNDKLFEIVSHSDEDVESIRDGEFDEFVCVKRARRIERNQPDVFENRWGLRKAGQFRGKDRQEFGRHG